MWTRQMSWVPLVGVLVLMPVAAAEEKVAHANAPAPRAPLAEEPEGSQAEATAAPIAPAPVAPAPPAPAPTYKTKEEAVRAQLEGTTWNLTLSPADETSNAKPKTDTLSFEADKISSEWLSKSGYTPSRYSLTINGSTPVLDTMQSNEKEGTVLWHAEVVGSSIRGIVSERPKSGKNMDFMLSGSEAGGKTVKVPSQSELQPSPR